MSSVSNIQEVSISRGRASDSALPAWRLILKKELADLWIGGKALILILVYSILLGAMAYISSFSTELNMIPPREAVSDMLWNAMAVSTFLGLIIGADSLSGERDRATLESLLLTPISRRQIIVAKLLAGLSTWPIAFIVAVPYLYVLAQGDAVLVPALFWGAVTGTMLVLGYTGMGMLISFWSSSNKVSYFVSLGIYALLLIPAELPGDTVEMVGQVLQWINPMAATNRFLSKQLIDYAALTDFWTWLISSTTLAVLSVTLLVGYAGSGLRLEAGTKIKFWAKLRRATGISIFAAMIILSLLASPASALQGARAQVDDFVIAMDSEARQVEMGEIVEVRTAITNNSAQTSPSLIVAMNIVNLDETGDLVDPEDWSPERTQYIRPLPAGESINLDWTINPILEGNFMVYMVLLPIPARAQTTSQMVASSGLQLNVTPLSGFKPASVLPLAIGEPILLLAITYFVYRHRRQQIDVGGSS